MSLKMRIKEKLYSIMPFSLFKSTYSYLDHLLLFKFYKMNGSDLIFELKMAMYLGHNRAQVTKSNL